MRSRFTVWSNQGILTPKVRTGGSRLLGPIAACLVCGIAAGGVYSQIVPERGTVSTTGAGNAEQPTQDPQSSEPRGTAVDANARAGAASSESAAKPELEPRRIDVDARQGPAQANAAEGNAELGKNTAHGNAAGKADQKSRATKPSARGGSNVQVYVTPDEREISVRRPVRGDGYAAFEPWDRNERSSRRVPAHSGPFDWFTMPF
jgi:hypothetical protein